MASGVVDLAGSATKLRAGMAVPRKSTQGPVMVPSPARFWRTNVDDYATLIAFKFSTPAGMDSALAFFFAEPELKGAPFKTVSGDTFFVPEEAESALVKHLQRGKIAFNRSRVLESSEVPPATMAKLRRQNRPSF